MRQILATALMLVPWVSLAQMGTVQYSHTYPVLYGHYFVFQEMVSADLGQEFEPPPTHRTVSRTLLFDTNASLMYPTDRPHVEPEDRKASEGDEHIDTTFVHFDDDTYSESRAINAEIYIVYDEVPSIPWRLNSEERVYLGLRVMKATAVTESSTIEAWFTPQIPIPAGPGLFGGLPGLILMVTNPETGEVYAAESLSQDTLARAITPPARGDQVSNEQYQRIKAASIAKDRREWEKTIEKMW